MQTLRNDVINMQINVTSPAATSLTKSCGKHCTYSTAVVLEKHCNSELLLGMSLLQYSLFVFTCFHNVDLEERISKSLIFIFILNSQ